MDCGVSPDELSAWSSAVSCAAAVITLWFLWKGIEQFRIASEQLRQSAHISLLTVEESLNQARHTWRSATFTMSELENLCKLQRQSDPQRADETRVRYARARDEEREAYEQFLNRLDRLCVAVRDGLVAEERARTDYHAMIETVVRCDPSLQFRTTSLHENITHLYLKWRSE